MEHKRSTSNRLLTGMVIGMALGVVGGIMLDPSPGKIWERFLARTSGAEEEARLVEKVIDGDTIEIDGGERVRYIGVDSPELGEPLYEEARDFQKKVVLGSYVRIEACKEEPRDGYGRTPGLCPQGERGCGRATPPLRVCPNPVRRPLRQDRGQTVPQDRAWGVSRRPWRMVPAGCSSGRPQRRRSATSAV